MADRSCHALVSLLQKASYLPGYALYSVINIILLHLLKHDFPEYIYENLLLLNSLTLPLLNTILFASVLNY